MFVALLASAQEPKGQKSVAVERELVERFDQGRKWAVVIGVNRYLDPLIPSLQFCVADARLVARTLVEKCGYEDRRILAIVDDQEAEHLRPLGINLRKQVAAWLKNAVPGDTVLVFFSGHGFLDARGQAFLAPKDCEKENLGLTGFRVDDLRDALMQCKATQKLLVLDCCHAGGLKAGDAPGPSSSELGAAFRDAAGLITLASCQKSEQSREWADKQQGLFTHFLTQGLQGAADFDGNGVVDSDEIYRYTLDEVRTTAQRTMNAQQTPVRFIPPDVVGVFALAKVEKKAPPETRRQATARSETTPTKPSKLLSPVALQSILAVGDGHRMAGEPAKALQFYDWGLKLDPGNRLAHARRGATYLALGRQEDAERARQLAGGAPLPAIVVQDGELKEESQVKGTVPKNWTVYVGEVRESWVWVTSAKEDPKLAGWIDKAAIALTGASENTGAVGDSLAGTFWDVRDSDGIPHVFLFAHDGKFYRLSANGFHCDGQWQVQGGEGLKIQVGAGTLEGRRTGDRISGSGPGAGTWEAQRR